MDTRVCNTCKLTLPVTMFWKGGNGYMYSCIKCTKAHRKSVADENKKANEQRGGPDPSVSSKKCSRCKEVKSVECYSLDFSRSDGLRTKCKDCCVAEGRFYRYGLTEDEYKEMHAKQNGRCAWCGRLEVDVEFIQGRPRLVVDHCHVTGKVRRLLCNPCNTAEGLIQLAWPDLLSVIEKHAYYPHGGTE